jgi:hypothetical protein
MTGSADSSRNKMWGTFDEQAPWGSKKRWGKEQHVPGTARREGRDEIRMVGCDAEGETAGLNRRQQRRVEVLMNPPWQTTCPRNCDGAWATSRSSVHSNPLSTVLVPARRPTMDCFCGILPSIQSQKPCEPCRLPVVSASLFCRVNWVLL